MPITHEQKADIGVGYTENIKNRVAVRDLSQKKAGAQCADLKDNSDFLRDIAKAITDRHSIEGRISNVRIDDDYEGGGRIDFLKINYTGGIFLRKPVSAIPSLLDAQRVSAKARALSVELCRELEFLHGMLAPHRVCSFQAHASRMWAPSGKDSRIPRTILNQLIEDFLTASRPAVCKVA